MLKLMLLKLEKCMSIFSVNKSEKTDFLNHFYKHCMHGKIAQSPDLES